MFLSVSVAKRLLLFLLASTIFLIFSRESNSLKPEPDMAPGLGIADTIYVISLPTRNDRREGMEKLRITLGLSWTYFDALPSTNPLVGVILGWVNLVRSGPPYLANADGSSPPHKSAFSWPPYAETVNEIDLWSVGPWASPFGVPIPSSFEPLPSATKDCSIVQNASKVPEHLVLTPSRVACWYSHLSVIQKIANSGDSVSIVLEDDIDMEKDIHVRLQAIWPILPPEWDIVFLGHCWSNESLHPPLTPPGPHHTRVHKSVSPKCTHAYALSQKGARRLLVHLRYPPFAFSRAIDQAIAWLVESGRVTSYSIVPSLVVQRKVTTSDVMFGKGTGSKWKDRLTSGVLQDLETSKGS